MRSSWRRRRRKSKRPAAYTTPAAGRPFDRDARSRGGYDDALLHRTHRMTPCRTVLALLLACLSPAFAAAPAAKPDPPLITLAERSGFTKTGRYDEVLALCDAFASTYP